MDIDELLDMIEGDGIDGPFDVECACGECHCLEPDGETTCDCGRLVQSPYMALGLI